MGLDMTLTARRHVSEYTDPELHAMMNALTESIRFGSDIYAIEVEAIYWRKANAIHKWFVDNVQDGRDECQRTRVTREQLVELLRVITDVVDYPEQAQELLPTQSGCFFGSTEINDRYWDELTRTRDRLREILEQTDIRNEWDFYYQSSW